MFKKRSNPSSHMNKNRGFSLIELMVGMMIGMIVVLVTGQMLTLGMAQRRAAATSTDSTINGSLGLYEIAREGARAGFGISAIPEIYGCTIVRRKNIRSASGVWSANVDSFTLAPVVIVDGASGASDTISFTSSHTKGAALPTFLQDVSTVRNAASAPFSEPLVVDSTFGMNVGDILVIAPPAPSQLTDTEIKALKAALQATSPGSVPTIPASLDGKSWCSLFQVTGKDAIPVRGAINVVDASTPANELHNAANMPQQIHRLQGSGNYDQDATATSRSSPYNDIPFPEYPKWSDQTQKYSTSSKIFNLGQSGPQTYKFQITDDRLRSDNTLLPEYPQVVQLQAQYGKDTNGDGAVDAWDNATPTTTVGWKQILAIRVAVVARSAQKESAIVTANTANCPDKESVCWMGGKITNLNADNPGANDWKYYRYRVFETTIPLRNSIWNMGV